MKFFSIFVSVGKCPQISLYYKWHWNGEKRRIEVCKIKTSSEKELNSQEKNVNLLCMRIKNYQISKNPSTNFVVDSANAWIILLKVVYFQQIIETLMYKNIFFQLWLWWQIVK